MDFSRLTSDQDPLFPEAFALYESSFPDHERRTLHEQTSLMANPLYYFTVILDGGNLAGILLYWEVSGYTYIEHFAIHSSMRGRTIGSNALASFCEERMPIILEIDPIVDETSIRRMRFYQRLGFALNAYAHKHPAYSRQFPPHELVVMSFPRPISIREYAFFRQILEGVVMKTSSIDNK